MGGSCRADAAKHAKALGVDPVVDFGFDPTPLKGSFDLVIDTAGTLSPRNARILLNAHGRIVDLNGSPAKMARSVYSRNFKPLIAKYTPDALETVADAASDGTLTVPVARTVPLAQAIDALTDLERTRSLRGGKLVIIPQ